MNADERFEKWWASNWGSKSEQAAAEAHLGVQRDKRRSLATWLACEAARDAEIEAACKELEARACDAIELANVRLLRSRLLPAPRKAGE